MRDMEQSDQRGGAMDGELVWIDNMGYHWDWDSGIGIASCWAEGCSLVPEQPVGICVLTWYGVALYITECWSVRLVVRDL
jgi:hypothetical protein